LTQIAPKKYQTVFGTLHQSSIGIGMICAQSLSLALSRPFWWRGELGVAMVIGSVLLVLGGLIRSHEGEENGGEREEDEETALLGVRGEYDRTIYTPRLLELMKTETKQPISVKNLLTTSDTPLWRGCKASPGGI
jgi:hypothetical protein